MEFLHEFFGHHWMFILFSVLYVGLEALFPINKNQFFFRKEFGQDLWWYVFNNILIDRWIYAFIHYFALFFLPIWGRYVLYRITPEQWDVINLFPLKIENELMLGVILFLAIDFLAYWLHYFNHRIRFLWNFHILHHSPQELDWLSGSRSYWLDGLLSSLVPTFVLIFIHADEKWLMMIAVLDTHFLFLTHSNIRLRLGPLEKVFSNTHAHWWHHDARCHLRYGQNFGHYTLIWDKIFGTYYVEQGYPDKLGLSEAAHYPAGVVGRLFYPVTKSIGLKKFLPRPVNIDDDTIRPSK